MVLLLSLSYIWKTQWSLSAGDEVAAVVMMMVMVILMVVMPVIVFANNLIW